MGSKNSPIGAAAAAAAAAAANFNDKEDNGLLEEHTIPIDPAVTSVEVHGFLGWVTSSAAYVLFVLWAFTPDRVLENHAITYYPSKYWAIALPTWICVTVLFVYWVYEALNMMATPSTDVPLDELIDVIDTEETYFRAKGDERLLPLVKLPKAVVDAVMVHGMSPSDAERWYKRDGAKDPKLVLFEHGLYG